MAVFNIIVGIFTIIGVFATIIILVKDNMRDLVRLYLYLKIKVMYGIMQAGTFLIALFFFGLSIRFIFNDAPIKRIDLFVAPMYLFCMFAYACLTVLIYSSRKEILKNLDKPKEKGE